MALFQTLWPSTVVIPIESLPYGCLNEVKLENLLINKIYFYSTPDSILKHLSICILRNQQRISFLCSRTFFTLQKRWSITANEFLDRELPSFKVQIDYSYYICTICIFMWSCCQSTPTERINRHISTNIHWWSCSLMYRKATCSHIRQSKLLNKYQRRHSKSQKIFALHWLSCIKYSQLTLYARDIRTILNPS